MKKTFIWILSILMVIILFILYARYITTRGFVTNEIVIKDNNLPTSFNGFKVVHFSDIHYGRAITLKKINAVIDEINLINPDIVVFTGDLIDVDATLTDEDYKALSKSLKKINAKYGKYAIMGDEDYAKDESNVNLIFEQSNFKYLDNAADIIYNKNKDSIFIGGIGPASYEADKVDKLFTEEKDINYKIVLTHEPDPADKIVDGNNVSLILAGHSLNGQIKLPFIGPIYKVKNAKKYYEDYYEINNTKLYISSGIGLANINYRLGTRPSLNFYRIINS